jgi:hypothetical protein
MRPTQLCHHKTTADTLKASKRTFGHELISKVPTKRLLYVKFKYSTLTAK